MKQVTAYAILKQKTKIKDLKFVDDYIDITDHPCLFFFKTKKGAHGNANKDEVVLKVKLTIEVC